MAKNPVEVWLWLLLVMQPYNIKTNYVLSQCGYDAAQAARMIRDGGCPFLNDNEKKRAEEVRMGAVRQVLEICRENDIRVMTLDDEEYPRLLRNIKNPPVVLFVCGNTDAINRVPALTVVGTRNVTDYGVEVTKKICSPLAKMGTVIVSGMAVGADSAAHRACLDAGGVTVGVLGCGMLVNYPAENAELKRRIIANGGALISELLPHSKSFGGYFHHRNRILSGMSLGTLVTEASEKSGSLLTANHAIEQSREVFCIPPHDILSMRFSGVVPLLRDGAVPVFGYTDIVHRLLPYYTNSGELEQMLDNTKPDMVEYKKPRTPPKRKAPEETGSNKTGTAVNEPAKAAAELSPEETAVLELVSEQSADIDLLVEKSGMDYANISEIITNLELFGYIDREMDGSYTVSK